MCGLELATRASVRLPDGASVLDRVPHIAAEWHPVKNGDVPPHRVHAGSPLKAWWFCSQGHEWFATVRDRVRKGAGCPFCTGKRASPTNCVAAESRTFELWHTTRNLPETPWAVTVQSNRKFWWRCKAAHEWQATPNNVYRGSGCPRCVDTRDSKRERECREILERIMGHPFPKAKPSWLLSDRGFQLELDGYSEKLQLAFEHHGVQHYQYVPFFHSVQGFQRTQELDAIKRALCAERAIRLIEVLWDCHDIEAFLRSQLSAPNEVV